MLKQIGTKARQEIEAMGGRSVFLELRVKVEKAWRNNQNVLDRLGLSAQTLGAAAGGRRTCAALRSPSPCSSQEA